MIMRETFTFYSAVQTVFGRNSVRQVGDIAARLHTKRAFVLTDKILVKAGICDKVRDSTHGVSRMWPCRRRAALSMS